MEQFWIQLLALLTLLTQTGSDTTELIGAVGGAVTFRSPYTEGNAALWSFEDEPIVTVVFKDPPKLAFHKEEYETRVTISEGGRALSISQLSTEDAGTYSVTINGKISTFTLLVYRELPEPMVTCETQGCWGSNCLLSLRCSVPGAGFGNVSYTWRGWGQLWDEGSVVLPAVNKSSWDNLEPLRCTARNAVSSRNVTVIPRELCPGAPSGSGVGIWVAVGVTVGTGVVISLVFLVFFCKSPGWKKFHLSQSESIDTVTTVESTTVYDGVGPSQQVENATMTGLELV